jgi:hypothetical protein
MNLSTETPIRLRHAAELMPDYQRRANGKSVPTIATMKKRCASVMVGNELYTTVQEVDRWKAAISAQAVAGRERTAAFRESERERSQRHRAAKRHAREVLSRAL